MTQPESGSMNAARARLVDDRLFLYQQKTGTPVFCPLPPVVVEKLHAVTNDKAQFFFYDGTSQRESMVKSWDRVFQKVFARRHYRLWAGTRIDSATPSP